MSQRRNHPLLHLPLVLLAIGFALPYCWMLATALQPREQALSVPPQWLPRLWRAQIDDHWRYVTEPVPIEQDSLLVEISEGPEAGDRLLVPTDAVVDGHIQRRPPGVQTELVATPVHALRPIPAGHVQVRQWRLHKYNDRPPERHFLASDRVEAVVRPVWENFPLAIRSLSGDIADQQRPWLELLADSHLPWHAPGRRDTTVTFLTYLANTCLVAGLGVVGVVLSSSLAAYGLSRLRWRGQNAIFAATLATMMIPFPVLMVPLYAVFRELGWIGTLLPLWVPAWFGTAFNIFLLRQFFLTIPHDLSDAARIDGASEWRIWWTIVLPLAKPALAVVALFHFLYCWNDFLAPLLFLTDPADYTLALGLAQYQTQSGGGEWHLLMAAACLLVLPILILFFLTQRTFIQGIATTGSK